MARQRLEGTQSSWVKARLLAGAALAHPDLIDACGGHGGWRLAAIVHQLKGDGWPIRATPAGGGCEANPAVRYSVPPGWRPNGPAQLGLPL